MDTAVSSIRLNRTIAASATIVATMLLNVASADQPDAAKASASPQVTIEARALQSKVHTYIANLTEAEVSSFDDPLEVWRKPVCPLVAGLPATEGQYVFDRLTAVLNRVGVPMGATGCHPNFFVVATTQPESVLNGVWNRRYKVFGDVSPTLVKQFIATPRPVRVWYKTIPASADCSPVGSYVLSSNLVGTQFDGLPTFDHDGNDLRGSFVAVHDLLAVVAVIDLTKVGGLDWGQVTDYVAMTGLAHIDVDANVGDAPTILHLFDTPAGLSDWDIAFLKGVYHTDPVSVHQRWAISQQMVQDLSR
jgi:hypothetical protein